MNEEKILNLTPDHESIVLDSLEAYMGPSTILESALGALVLGQHYGWRVLKIIHNQSTYRKYEKILGIKFTDACPERTDLSKKSIGLKAADKLKSFWAVVRGKEEVPNKGMLVKG